MRRDYTRLGIVAFAKRIRRAYRKMRDSSYGNPGFRCRFQYTTRGPVLSLGSYWYGRCSAIFANEAFVSESIQPGPQMPAWWDQLQKAAPLDARHAHLAAIASEDPADVLAQIRAWGEMAPDIDFIGISQMWKHSLLTFTAFHGHQPSTEYLLSKGADPNCRGAEGTTPFMLANYKVFQLLLDAGGDVHSRDDHGVTVLMWSAKKSLDAVASLIARGAEVNDRDKRGATAIGRPSTLGEPDVLKFLLDHGALVNLQDENGTSPLMAAVTSSASAPRAVELLLAYGADLSLRNRDGYTALEICESEIESNINTNEGRDNYFLLEIREMLQRKQ